MSKKPLPIDAARMRQINQGIIETKNLTECLKVDFAALYCAIFPDQAKCVERNVRQLESLGILKRMDSMAKLLVASHGLEALNILETHSSDTARGWAAFVVGNLPSKSIPARLKQIRTFADDPHFGVREWAWMAVRRHIAHDLEPAIKVLSTWTNDESARVRRFASEATRPRGVWAEHIRVLKDRPELGLPVLDPLRSDESRYVQDSVANWLNDAAKSQPHWVKKICASWGTDSDSKATAYITKKAQRSFK